MCILYILFLYTDQKAIKPFDSAISSRSINSKIHPDKISDIEAIGGTILVGSMAARILITGNACRN